MLISLFCSGCIYEFLIGTSWWILTCWDEKTATWVSISCCRIFHVEAANRGSHSLQTSLVKLYSMPRELQTGWLRMDSTIPTALNHTISVSWAMCWWYKISRKRSVYTFLIFIRHLFNCYQLRYSPTRRVDFTYSIQVNVVSYTNYIHKWYSSRSWIRSIWQPNTDWYCIV